MSNVSPEDYEKVMLAADDLIKKSRGFMLFVVNPKGNFQSISFFGDLDSMQQVGLIRTATRITEITEDKALGEYDFNDQELGDSENDVNPDDEANLT